MSNIIPMVSSSPPPLDDGTGFDDWGDEDGDDFGNFMGAESSSNTVDNKGSGNQWGSNNNSDIHVIEDKSIPQFADFGKFSSELDSGKTNENHICVVENHESNHNGSNHLTNSDSGTYLDSPLSDSEVNIQGNINSDCVQSPGNILNQSSTIDSGLSVTDVTISPTAKSEDFQGSEKSERSEKIDKMVEDLDNVQSDIVEECEDFEEFQSSDVRKEDLENTASVCNESNYVISSQQGDLSHHENEAANSVSNGPTSQIQDGEESKHFNSDSDKNDENCYHGAELDSQSESPDQVSTDIESNEESQVSQLNSNLVCDNSVNHQKSEYSESDHVMCNFKSQNSDLKDEEDAGKEGDAGKEEDARKEISPQHSESQVEISESSCENERTERPSDSENDSCDEKKEEQSVDDIAVQSTDTETESSAKIVAGESHEDVIEDIGENVCSEKAENSDDEFNDFADFSSTPVNEVKDYCEDDSPDKKVTKLSDDDDFCDFADFNSPEKSKDDTAASDSIQQNDTHECDKDLTTDDKGDENDDDFEDFNSAPLSNYSNNNKDTSSTDNFGAFASNDNFAAFGDGASNDEDSGGGSWAAFNDQASEDQLVTNADDDDDDDDFNNFDDFQAVPVTKEPEVVKPAVSGVKDVFTVTFPASMVTGSKSENGVQLMNDDMVAESTNTEVLWTRLKKLDRGTSVLKWNDAKSNKNLFTSLKIDTRNILISHKKSVPIYAANLTLGAVLEPTKGPVKSIQSAASDSTLIDTSKPDIKPEIQESNKPRSNVGSKSTSEVTPVQFDWSSAGLTNPLESSNKTLDLDFLVMAETEAVTKSGELDWVSDSELMHGQKPTLQPLENILANLKVSTVKRGRQNEHLGEETRRILNSLPDLSFMHSKVLMFPLRHQSDP